ncbi:MAG: patatin-like phospholipase family protein [Nocardia sp.]|nr:patatin-like phospholipase family protein [Nocardia sp.]
MIFRCRRYRGCVVFALVNEKALVLGGGGAAGNAWDIGVVAGLFEAGVDVTGADLIIGTSAGSTAAAQISAAAPPRLLAGILDAAPPASGARGPGVPPANLLDRSDAIIAASADAADMRRRMGASALENDADDSAHARRRAIVAGRLPSPHWPANRILIVAVDARTGRPVVFDRDSGVDLADAVAASTSGPGGPPHRIGDDRYIDGGFRAGENADLATGFERVLIVAPLGGRSRVPKEWGTHLDTQVDRLRAAGSAVETIFPDTDSRNAFGANLMDPSTRPAAARASYAQGRARAEQLAEFWG